MYHPFKSQIVAETKVIITKRIIMYKTSIVILKTFLLNLFDIGNCLPYIYIIGN